jgi:sugar phosphate isomerase/epimerase
MVRLASESGFATIAPNPAQYREAIAAGWTDHSLRQLLVDNGITVAVIDPLVTALAGSPDRRSVPERFRWLFQATEDDCYRAAHALGATTINVAPFLGSVVDENELADSLGALCARAARHALAIAVEFMPDTGVPTLAAALNLIGPQRHHGATVTFDTWHFVRSGGRLSDLDHIAPGSIGILQINDRQDSSVPYVPMSDRLLPGEGTIPLAEILAPILEREPHIRVGLEVFSDALIAMDGAEVARLGASATLRVIRHALALFH